MKWCKIPQAILQCTIFEKTAKSLQKAKDFAVFFPMIVLWKLTTLVEVGIIFLFATETRERRVRAMAIVKKILRGMLTVLIAAVSTIVLKLLGQDLLAIAAGCAVSVLVLLYWVCYMVLKKKY
jgi:hypothetical protein